MSDRNCYENRAIKAEAGGYDRTGNENKRAAVGRHAGKRCLRRQNTGWFLLRLAPPEPLIVTGMRQLRLLFKDKN